MQAHSAHQYAINPAAIKDVAGFDVRAYGAKGDGTTDDTAAIQAAIDAASSAGRPVVARGTFKIASGITIKGDTDFATATLNFTNTTGTAVTVGTGPNFTRKVVLLPKVECVNKPGTGWLASTIGVKILNAYECYFDVPFVYKFLNNLVVTGVGSGCTYNRFSMGTLAMGKVNLWLTGDGAGWPNQNTFIGGRLMQDPAEGLALSGSAQIKMDYVATLTGANNNAFLNTSLEGTMAEYMIDCDGSYNMFLNCRFEGTAAVRWGSHSFYNEIIGGHNASAITETVVGTGAQQRNMITATGRWDRIGSKAGPMMKFDNTNSSAQPAVAVWGAGTLKDGTTSETTGYRTAVSANAIGAKTASQAELAVAFLATDGSLAFGDGTTAPVKKIKNAGAGAIAVDTASILFTQNNTYDIGLASNRPRYVRAGTAVQTGTFTTAGRPAAATAGAGAMIYDTTLNKPTWSDGTNWRDATGTIV